MDLPEMRNTVRRDLHDEDSANYRWTDNEIDRHILHTVREFSLRLPLEQKATLATTAGSREIDISSLSDRVTVEAVEYPAGLFPPCFHRFALWGDALTLLGNVIPDGSNCDVYYGKLHTIDASMSTLPPAYEDIIATGAEGYAALEWASFATNRVNAGGNLVAHEYNAWGKDRLVVFLDRITRLGRANRLRTRSLYVPYAEPVSRTCLDLE